jgi:hypothetical protein
VGGGTATLSFSDLSVPPFGYYQTVIILNGSDMTGFSGADGNFTPNFQANLILGKGFAGIRNLNGGWGLGNSLQGDPSANAVWNVHTVPDSDPIFPNGNIGGSFSDGSQTSFFSRFQTLVGGAGASTFNLMSTPKNVTTDLFGNTGNDVFNVGDPGFANTPNHTLDPLQGPVGISGQGFTPGNPQTLTAFCMGVPTKSNAIDLGDQVNLWDSSNSATVTYTLSPGLLLRTGAAPISFGNVNTVTLYAGTGMDTVDIEGTLNATNTIINGAGTGPYTFIVNNTGANSNTTLNGVSGSNTITINNTGSGSILQASAPGNLNTTSTINLNAYGQNSGIRLLGGNVASSFTTFNVVLDSSNLNSFIDIEGRGGSATLVFFLPGPTAGFDTNTFAFVPEATGSGMVNVIATNQAILCFAGVTSIPQTAFTVSSFLLPTQDSQGRPNFSIILNSALTKTINLTTAPFASVLAQASPASPFGFSAPTVALAKVSNDTVPDLIVALGSGFVPLVTIFAGRSLFVNPGAPQIIAQFFAYSTAFAGGVYVAAGNISHRLPGQPDIVTGPGQGGGSVVSVFEYNGSFNANIFPGGGVAPLTAGGFNGSFISYPNFFGGVRVAVGDTTGSGTDDIITAPGPGGGPNVKVFNGQAIASGAFDPNTSLRSSFMAYDPSFTGGVFVAAGVYNANANPVHADILTGPGFTGGPNVKVFDGINPAVVLESFFAFPLTTTTGLGGSQPYAGVGSVAFDDSIDSDGNLDITVGSGLGQPAEARVFDGEAGNPMIPPDAGIVGSNLVTPDTFFLTLDGTTAMKTQNPSDPNILRAAVNVGGFPFPRT